MLYNVVLGDTRHVSDKWKLIKEGDFYFYEKADLGQRILKIQTNWSMNGEQIQFSVTILETTRSGVTIHPT